jgi:hypothetical protein
MSLDELEIRKKNFQATIKTENWQKIGLSFIVGCIFLGYFISVLINHEFFIMALENL